MITIRQLVTQPTHKQLAVITLVIIFFIPTVTLTFTVTNHTIWETAFYFPWLILIHFRPDSYFLTDQYHIIGFPLPYLLAFPLWWAAYQAVKLLKSGEEQSHFRYKIVIGTMAHLVIIGILLLSQDKDADNFRYERIYPLFIPQLLILILYRQDIRPRLIQIREWIATFVQELRQRISS